VTSNRQDGEPVEDQDDPERNNGQENFEMIQEYDDQEQSRDDPSNYEEEDQPSDMGSEEELDSDFEPTPKDSPSF
jgi:hypothetical protein